MTIKIFYRYLFSDRAGSIVKIVAQICMLGVTVGVTALIVVLSVMNGFNESIQNKYLALEPHIVIEDPPQNVEELLGDLKRVEGVEVSPYVKYDVILRSHQGHFSGAVAKGVLPKSLDQILQRLSKSSKLQKKISPIEPHFSLDKNEVIIGSELAYNLDVYEGDQLIVIPPEALILPEGEAPKYNKVTVRKVVYSELTAVDAQLVYFPLTKALKGMKESAGRENGLEIQFKDYTVTDVWAKKMNALGLVAKTWKQRNSSLFLALRLEKTLMTLFLGLAAVITCFSIITVLVLLITQKQKDIGIFQVLGLSQHKTRQLFVRFGLLLSSFGMGVGIFLGLSLVYFLDKYPLDILPDIYYDSSIPASIDWSQIGVIALCCLVVAIIGAWLPSHQNICLTPAEALRSIRRK